MGEIENNTPPDQTFISVPFEYITNLVGETVYKCEFCGIVLADEHVNVHAVISHNASYISIHSIPLDVTKENITNDSNVQN